MINKNKEKQIENENEQEEEIYTPLREEPIAAPANNHMTTLSSPGSSINQKMELNNNST